MPRVATTETEFTAAQRALLKGVPTFGGHSTENIDRWVKTVSKVAIQIDDWPTAKAVPLTNPDIPAEKEKAKLLVLASKLRDNALSKWLDMPERAPDGRNWTLDSKLEVFRKKYSAVNPIVQGQLLLAVIRGEHQSVRDYADQVEEIGQKVDTNIDQNLLSAAFVNGLRPQKLKDRMMSVGSMARTFEELVSGTMSVESTLETRGKLDWREGDTKSKAESLSLMLAALQDLAKRFDMLEQESHDHNEGHYDESYHCDDYCDDGYQDQRYYNDVHYIGGYYGDEADGEHDYEQHWPEDEVQCYNCGGWGHVEQECPSEPQYEEQTEEFHQFTDIDDEGRAAIVSAINGGYYNWGDDCEVNYDSDEGDQLEPSYGDDQPYEDLVNHSTAHQSSHTVSVSLNGLATGSTPITPRLATDNPTRCDLSREGRVCAEAVVPSSQESWDISALFEDTHSLTDSQTAQHELANITESTIERNKHQAQHINNTFKLFHNQAPSYFQIPPISPSAEFLYRPPRAPPDLQPQLSKNINRLGNLQFRVSWKDKLADQATLPLRIGSPKTRIKASSDHSSQYYHKPFKEQSQLQHALAKLQMSLSSCPRSSNMEDTTRGRVKFKLPGM